MKNKKYLSATDGPMPQTREHIYLSEIKGHIDNQPLKNLIKILERWESKNYYSKELETEQNGFLFNYLLKTIKSEGDYEKRRDITLLKDSFENEEDFLNTILFDIQNKLFAEEENNFLNQNHGLIDSFHKQQSLIINIKEKLNLQFQKQLNILEGIK